VQIAHALGDAQMWSGQWEESVDTLERGIAVAPAPAAATVLRSQILRAATGSARVRHLTADRLAELRAREHFDPDERLAMGLLAIELAMTNGPVDRVVALAHRALADQVLLAGNVPEGIHELTATALALVDDETTSLNALDAAVDQARRRGNAMLYARASALRAWSLLRFGRPAEAEADARSALELDEAARFNAVLLPLAVGALIGAVLECRGAAEARAVADEYAAVTADDDAAGAQPLPVARAELALAERRPELALAELEVCRRWERAFSGSSVGFASWRPTAVAAHLALGDPDAAAELAAQQAAFAVRFGGATVMGVAEHSTALVTRDLARMERAVDTLRGSPARTLLARALTDHGAMLRAIHQPVAARTPLREALDIADRAGAEALALAVLEELEAAGARPVRRQATGLDALTPAERRATRMAAEGLTNRQIAQASFVSPRTIEMHLSNAYRKLGVEGRGDLAGLLPAGAG
jgi:DNA-binding CsgD family transcriptional regulator